MKKKHHIFLYVILIIILCGCGTAATPEPVQEMEAIQTEAAGTISAQYSSEGIILTPEAEEEEEDSMIVNPAEPVNLPTVVSGEATQETKEEFQEDTEMMILNSANEPTSEDPADSDEDEKEMMVTALSEDSETMIRNEVSSVTPTAETSTSTPKPTEVEKTIEPSTIKKDKALYLGQTPQDGSHVNRESEFDVVWELENAGTTTWTRDYSLRYFSNTNFTKQTRSRWRLPKAVAPGESVKCVVDAVAPAEPGTYTMAMVLGNENDENFMIVDIKIIVD